MCGFLISIKFQEIRNNRKGKKQEDTQTDYNTVPVSLIFDTKILRD